MKRLTRFTAAMLTATAIAFALSPAPVHAAADAVSSTQELHVTAQVLPMRHIIVDYTGAVVSITSNTDQDVTPQVFLQSDLPQNLRPYSADIARQYRAYVPAGSAQRGIIYQRPLPSVTSAAAGAFSPDWVKQ